MDIYTSTYTKEEIDNGVALGLASPQAIFDAVKLIMGLEHGGYTTSETTVSDFSQVLIDLENRIIAGIRSDGTLYLPTL